jgi:diguanylate cyclase (GGDEF)-like protein
VQAEAEKNVLFISSYHGSFDTLPEQIKGIQSVFNNKNIKLDIEYMDSRRFSTEENYKNFYNFMKYKLERMKKYDAILIGDDNALQFAMDHKNDLFKENPIVFFAINELKRAELANKDPYFTGLIEAVSLSDNIDIAIKFNPKAKKVVAIVDDTLTGKGDGNSFYALQDSYKGLKFEDIDASKYTFDEIKDKISDIESDTILLYLSMFTDKTGKTITIDEAVSIISNSSKVPVYRASIGGVGKGLLGGKMITYFEQGKTAAELVLEILSGRSPENISMITKSPNKYIFDYNIIKRYGINEKLIPKDAILINKRIGFYEQNKKVLLPLFIILIVLTLISAVAIYDNIKRRAIERKLIEYNEEIAALYEEIYASEEELRDKYTEVERSNEMLQESEERYKELAYTDMLTSLHNRNALQLKLKQILSIENSSIKGSLMFLDLDNFKLINDTFGHMMGDEILKIIGNNLKYIQDDNIFVARIGGDEFVIIGNNIYEEEEIKKLAYRVQNIVNEKHVLGEKEFYMTASIGIAKYPDNGIDINEILRNVDSAMYKAKDLGKDQITFFDEKISEGIYKKMNIQNKIRHALENQEFMLYYQPQVNTVTKEIIGYEALLRWNSKDRGIVYPGEFIAIAEEIGLTFKIGNWVIQNAFEFAKKINSEGLRKYVISINISPLQLNQGEFVNTIKEYVDKIDVNPECIGIEITETSLMSSFEANAIKLKELMKMGIKISLDDFGTGYSSLNYLRKLPIDTLKIDKSFIDDLVIKNEKNDITNDIILIAHKLGLSVVAEGVETEEQYNILKDYNCDIIQGYYFSRPIPESDIFKK